MITVERIEIEDVDNAGCNNGNYPDYTIIFDDGVKHFGTTCRCGNGCSGTDNINWFTVGATFKSYLVFVECMDFHNM